MDPGDIVAGKYCVTRVLGQSRGLLLEARHREFDQRVVIRLLSPVLCDEKEIEQFRREAQTLSKLESEHVARIIDVGTDSDGSFFLVRQYVDGIDLATHINNQGAMQLDEAVLYLLHVAEAVQEAHSHNIILRELQPAHLFLTKKRGGSPLVKLVDFGTAKLLKDPASMAPGGAMAATVMFGMSQYSSPELVRRVRGIDGRTDVWSLGCTLYEMLAAVPPFQGKMAELMLKITRDEPVALSDLRPDLPAELDQIIGWALAKERESRFSSVYALAHSLREYASAEGQLLIDQIGRLAHAEAADSDAAALISPTSPLAQRSASSPPTNELGEGATGQRAHESEIEQAAYLDDGSLAPDQRSPGSTPGYAPGSAAPPAARESSDPPPPAARESSDPPPPAQPKSWVEPEPAALSNLSNKATVGDPAPKATGKPTRLDQHKTTVVAICAALVFLPVLVVLLNFALRRDTGDTLASREPAVTAGTVAGAPSAGVIAPAAPGAPSAAVPAPEGSGGDTKPAASSDDGGGVPPPEPTAQLPPKPTATGPRTTRTQTTTTKPPPESKPTADPGKKKKTGTLVAIAIGGTCAFAVDGAPKGTKSNIRVVVPLGVHTVSCAPAGKAARTQRVTVKAGKPGIASFRVN